jgi:hypothetical protein
MTRRFWVATTILIWSTATLVFSGVGGSAGAAPAAHAAQAAQLGPATVPGAHFVQPAVDPSPQLSFAGYQWSVKNSTTPIGPGPNVFDATGPYVDSSNALHLQLLDTPTGWEASEVVMNGTLGYGTYRWTVDGPLSTLDPNVVFALFTYDDSDPAYANRELDFEASRFGDTSDPTNAQYVVQPYTTAGNLQRITLPLTGVTTVTMTWLPGRVTFSADSGSTWTNTSSSVPTSSTEQLHMSLFSFLGAPPSNGQPVSVAITNFQFTPSHPIATITSPTNNQTVAVGQTVRTAFTCTEGADGSPVSTCLDSNGAASPGTISTSTPGTYTYSVTTVDNSGERGTTSVTYRVVPHGYWLVGSDGGIFAFGSATFYGSTGSLHLVRPVVGITPTATEEGYWLVGSDGGVFAFGDAGFYGSLPGLGLAPAGTPGRPHLNAPIAGVVPSVDDGGYFMVGSDGGVFAFGDAQFEGSCPGIGGCSGSAVAVTPDASGRGYWLVTAAGHIYSFGDAPYYGAPGPQSSPITSLVRTPDGGGYWILEANGKVFNYGNAASLGSIAAGTTGGLNPATAIFATLDGGGYWVTTATGAVYAFGDAPYEGGTSGAHLNGAIIAASGY